MQAITISPQFKQQASKAILSIIFFVFVYILLVVGALALTVACGYGGIMLIMLKPSVITLMLGIGLMSVGVLILFFLIKFMFTRNKTDRSNLIEITATDEPELFAFIEDIVKQVNTNFPKKVYISSEVNASVFYDSGFWSMFLPVKKNLHIGLGLMNAVTVDEFKGILAHEFGHFSQRSMKVGSYVYNVNYVLHNMLYDNDGYNKLIGRWASVSGYFSIFVLAGIKMVGGIQWVLGRVYNNVNINYLGLSREMEFHADEVAAHVAGPQALATSLVRLDLANSSLQQVLNFYHNKIADNLKPLDIFPQQHLVMTLAAADFDMPIENNLPQVTLATKNRFNKSKLVFEDQWASHPSEADRIKRLEGLNITIPVSNVQPALSLFKDKDAVQAKITAHLFSEIEYSGTVAEHAIHEFTGEFTEKKTNNSLPKKFNNYFDDLTPGPVDFEALTYNTGVTEEALFNSHAIDLVYEKLGLEADLQTTKQLTNSDVTLKSFDYDGQRYRVKDAYLLIENIEQRLKEVEKALAQNNAKIYDYYYHLAEQQGTGIVYKAKYNKYLSYDQQLEQDNNLVQEMYRLTGFINQTTSIESIKASMYPVYEKEKELKAKIKTLLETPDYKEICDKDVTDEFQKYVYQNWLYFNVDSYNDEALGLLFNCLHNFIIAGHHISFKHKKDFLDFQASLITN